MTRNEKRMWICLFVAAGGAAVVQVLALATALWEEFS